MRATKQAASPRVVAYIRVSTDKQAEQGQSLEAQQAKVQAYATLHELVLVEVVVETGSAKSLTRPGLARALGMLGDTADALLVTKLDRLTRSVKDLGELVETHFQTGKHILLSVGEHIDTSSAAGRLVLNVLASVSQWEREAIGERTSAVMQHMRSRGEYTGGPVPYGFSLQDSDLVIDEVEQAILKAAAAHRSAGLSLAKVSEALASNGMLNRNGKPFAREKLWKMLQSPAPSGA